MFYIGLAVTIVGLVVALHFGNAYVRKNRDLPDFNDAAWQRFLRLAGLGCVLIGVGVWVMLPQLMGDVSLSALNVRMLRFILAAGAGSVALLLVARDAKNKYQTYRYQQKLFKQSQQMQGRQWDVDWNEYRRRTKLKLKTRHRKRYNKLRQRSHPFYHVDTLREAQEQERPD